MYHYLAADIGVPMIFLQGGAMSLLLVPVVLLEWAVVRQKVELPPSHSLGGVLIANLASTAFGVPLAWLLMLGLQLLTAGGQALGLGSPLRRLLAVTLQAAWLIPYESDLYWMIPAASITLLVPSFFLSVLIERFVYVHLWDGASGAKVTHATWLSNLASYSLLFVIAIGVLLWSLNTNSLPIRDLTTP